MKKIKLKLIPCKLHGTKYLLDPNGPSQCADPQCIINTIAHTAKRSRKTRVLWQMIVAKGLQEDCGSYVLEKLLDYCKKKEAKGTPWAPLINWNWLRFKLLNYVEKHINRRKAEFGAVQEAIEGMVETADFVSEGTHGDHAYRAVLYQEVADRIEKKYGIHWVLYFQNAISMLDVVKIESKRFSVISPKAKRIRSEIMKWAEASPRRMREDHKDNYEPPND